MKLFTKNTKKGGFFIGIDLGGKEKKTTGVCILEKEGVPLKNYCQKCQDILGKEILKKINPYLKETKVIAIDAPLTRGRGKGNFRLYEKFLSTKIFRKEKVNPLPPALMPKLCQFALELRKELEEESFVLDLNLIEVFPTLVKKIVRIKKNLPCQSENQKMAFICGLMAYWHFSFKTRYLGYKDGFLFLPEMAFWRRTWQKKFFQTWDEKPYLKYRHLKTNLF